MSAMMYMPTWMCSTPAMLPIWPNSTVDKIISACLADVLLPSGPVLLAFCALATLCLHSLLFGSGDGGRLAIGRMLLAKSALYCADVALSLVGVLFAFVLLVPEPSPHPEQQIGAALAAVFSIFVLCAHLQCVRCGYITSGLMHLTWFVRLISLLPAAALALNDPNSWHKAPLNLVTLLHAQIALALVLLLCWPDTPTSLPYRRLNAGDDVGAQKELCPESASSAFSAITYSYASKMVWLGLRGTVSFDQLWELQDGRQSEVLRDRFYRSAKCRGGAEPGGVSAPINLCSLLWRMLVCTWEWILSGCGLAILIVLSRYANASFLKLIVGCVTAQYPLWLPMVALSFLFLVDMAGKVLTARRDFDSFMAQMNIRSLLTNAIFDKMLKLSAAARGRYSAGEVLNLLTTDVMRIRFFWHQLRDFIYCPFMVAFAFVGLFMEIGLNTLYGVGVLIAVLPLNYVLSKLQNQYEQLQMKYKDERLRLVNDVLSGMKVLKLYAWEESMQRQIFELRRKEVKTLQKIFFLDAGITVSFQLAPLIATLVSFFGYTILQGNPMRPDVAFVSLLFFGMLRFSIYQIPQLLAYSIKALVSCRRVLKFLNEEEQQPSHLLRDVPPDDGEPIVSLRNCSFTWGSASVANPTLHLHNLSLDVQRGALIGIVGRVGNGKSSLLSAILGEMERAQDGGTCAVRASSVGYVPQQPWIQNKSLRANVLFDAPFDEARYRRVLAACALEDDLRLLAAGDQTEIGEKGINLSGGQKARVALARAVYMDADLYVLDDTLSAVDAHVGAHIFERVIGSQGLLAGKTRLFALNSLSFLRHCERIVVMDGGRLSAVGTLDELKHQSEGPFADLMREYVEKHVERQKSLHGADSAAEEEDEELAEVLDQLGSSPLSKSLLEHRRMVEQRPPMGLPQSLPTRPAATNGAPPTEAREQVASPPPRSRFTSHSSSVDHTNAAGPHQEHTAPVQQHDSAGMGRLTEEEELCTGMVSRRVYLDYARAFGIWLSVAFVACLFLGSSTFEALSSVWLAKWSSSNATSPEEASRNLAIYGAFNAVYVLATGVSGTLIAVGAYYASTAFHDQLVQSLFHSPMSFFDRTPLGRILNRLSNDIDRIDENIPFAVGYALTIFAEAINSLISICVVIPMLVLVVVPLMAIFLAIVHFYNVASVQFRRLTSKSWSTVCSFVQDAHQGSDSIRVFNVVERFRDKSCRLADITNESFTVEIFTNRWLQIRLDLLSDCAVFVCVMVAILMASKGIITLGALAMVIGCGYTFTGFLGEIARVWRESEVQMVCIERVGEYIRNEREAEWRLPRSDRDLGDGGMEWPSVGRVEFRRFWLKYRPDTEPVLHNLSFTIEGGEKVGIVGRTGAGKSSLTLALFRIVEPHSGQILIDGVDIARLGLHDLREALTIIPQDPVLFCGSLRSNLDPFKEHSDDRVWEALEKAHLKETVSALEGQLAHEVTEGGSNLSVGQRQLVCLGRALLRQKTRILVLDEATAAVDADTDSRIQTSIRTHFKHCTVLTIAHRLHTILDYDRVLVMDKGRVAELDSPRALLANGHSQFAQMARQAGINTKEQLIGEQHSSEQ